MFTLHDRPQKYNEGVEFAHLMGLLGWTYDSTHLAVGVGELPWSLRTAPCLMGNMDIRSGHPPPHRPCDLGWSSSTIFHYLYGTRNSWTHRTSKCHLVQVVKSTPIVLDPPWAQGRNGMNDLREFPPSPTPCAPALWRRRLLAHAQTWP